MSIYTTTLRVAWLITLSVAFVLLWSSGWAVSSLAVSEANALGVLSIRYVIVAMVLVLLITLLGQWRTIRARNIKHHLLIGVLCHALYLLASIGSFEWGVSATVVAFITSLQPVATAVMATSITGEHIGSRRLKGIFLGTTSVMLIISGNYQTGAHSFALLLPFIAMISMTLGTVLHSRWEIHQWHSTNRRTPLLIIMLLQITGALCVFLPAAALTDNLHWSYTIREWQMIMWLALVVSLGAYGAFILLLRHLSSIFVSSLIYLVPPATMLQMYYMAKEPISTADMIALGVASVAVYMIATPKRTSTGSRPRTKRRLRRVSALR